MYFMNRIISYLNDVSDFFYDAYREVWNWVYPFYYLGYPLYSLCLAFNHLAWEFYDFADWVDYIEDIISDVITWWDIEDWFYDWKRKILDAWYWFVDRWYWFRTEVNNWWSSVQYTVQGWINTAFANAKSLIDQVSVSLTNLWSAWNNFKGKIPSLDQVLSWFGDWWGYTLSSLIAWGALKASQISTLIDSAFTIRDSLWAGWQELRDQVIEFFNDPLEYLWSRFTDWFLGPEG